MNPEQWAKAKAVFELAVEAPEASRASLVHEACGGDPDLEIEVMRLLRAHSDAGDFLEESAGNLHRALDAGDASTLQAGAVLAGRFEVRRFLNGGGMGEVYEALDRDLNQAVAIKIISPRIAAVPGVIERFKQEVRHAREISHPNICRVHELFCDESGSSHRWFLSMELLLGPTLLEHLRAHGPFPPPEGESIASQLCAGLEAAHARRLVHRDFKSGNVILTSSEDGGTRAVITDFGLALRVSGESAADVTIGVGTPGYMSPEQRTRGRAGPLADQYAFGAVLSEIATGWLPSTPTDSRRAHRSAARNGYPSRWDAVVQRCTEPEPRQRFPDMAAVRAALLPSAWVRYRSPLLSAAAVLLLLLFLGRAWKQRHDQIAEAATIRSIAVLPMENRSADAEQGYFADSVTDGVTTQLSQVASLRVVPRTSVAKYRDHSVPVEQIARDLHVDAVVEGAVYRDGDRMRVTADLVRASDDRQLWADSYDRNVQDVLGLQAELADAIATRVKAVITPGEKQRLQKKPTVDPVAYELYLQGKYHGNTLRREDNDRAIEFFEKAVARDPSFSPAYAALAFEYVTRANKLQHSDEEWNRRAYAAVEKCIELDPELADCYLTRSTMIWSMPNHFPHASAVAELKHALQLNPSLDEAEQQLANIYNHIGMFAKAKEHLARASELNPANTGARFRIGVNLNYQGKYQEAFNSLEGSERYSPIFWGYADAFSLLHLGRLDEAEAVLQKMKSEDNTDGVSMLISQEAVLAALRGDRQTAEAKIAEAARRGRGFEHFHHSEFSIACAYAIMHEPRLAMQWLRRAADDGFPCYPVFLQDPFLNNLREDPEFKAFMSELKTEWEHNMATL